MIHMDFKKGLPRTSLESCESYESSNRTEIESKSSRKPAKIESKSSQNQTKIKIKPNPIKIQSKSKQINIKSNQNQSKIKVKSKSKAGKSSRKPEPKAKPKARRASRKPVCERACEPAERVHGAGLLGALQGTPGGAGLLSGPYRGPPIGGGGPQQGEEKPRSHDFYEKS